MGMYTEIFVNVDLKPETPDQVLAVLRAICGSDNQAPLADKPRRWALLFNNGSYYTPLTSCANLTFDKIAEHWSLLGKGDIKNYEGEIEEFFSWLMPWINGEEGDFVGYKRYEENAVPTLVLLAKEPLPAPPTPGTAEGQR